MLISFGYDISLRLEVETAVLFCLRIHPSRRKDLVSGENFRIEPQRPFEEYSDGYGNRCGRVHCKPGVIRFVNRGVIRDSGALDDHRGLRKKRFSGFLRTLWSICLPAAIVRQIASSRILRGRTSAPLRRDGLAFNKFAISSTVTFSLTT